MLITLCYVYLWVRFQRCYAGVVRSALDRLRGSRSSFAFCALKAEGSRRRAGHPTRDQTLRRPRSPVSQEDTVFLRLGDKVIYVTELQVLTWSDYCLPLACRPGQPYRAVAEASLDNFSTLGVAFLEDRLQMENGLIPEKIVSVYLRESALKELFEKQQGKVEEKPKLLPARIPEETILSATSLYEQEAESVLRACRSSPPLADRQDSDSDPSSESRPACDQQGQPRPVAEHSHMEGHHHLHLSSCHECLELENSTIQSVKFASVENIPDLPDDDCAGGDVAAGSQASPGRANARGKPPNVLVFTGGCEERYGRIRALLAECIDVERYTIYQLRPQQALSEPWLESTALLVLADDGPLTPQLQLCFLTYLSQGGRVLGLSSALCPAGLRLRPRRGQRGRICRLSFTKADSTEVELSALTGGMTYEREPRDGDASRRVEVWGELRAPDTDRDAVIIRVSHGEEGGEAVLCQVCLETAPDSEQVQGAADFSELKMSNARRYEVLTEIFTSLGLSCELSQMPPPSPVYVLSTQSELRDSFVHWLRGNVDDGGVVRCAGGARLRVVWGPGEAAMLAEGELALHPEAPEILPKHFCMQTYSRHLQTQRLGRTLLYANVTPTTMDLLEGMMLQLPDDMGLIAVAARQTKGKGRAGNAWLGPLGSAMFTLHLRVEVSSTLGRRVPFLQHLAALAMVEAVRTLPGYEDIDLRVKWPNDIYFGNLIKLGGVLVSSTAMASTFHLLVGCGLNVSNSNPTICVNDLVAQHNREHGCSLEPLSPEQLIGRSVTLLEELIGRFQLQGPQAALPLYYQRWVHGGTQVRLWSEEGPVADVVGLDDHGFLQVSSREHGLVSVQPDGNSFDMMRNLVVTKH
ncbi:biotin--protein ligase isoform X2 [Electrophorus electricus]|uniref:biotin--protein ligase isoform X2 n=1 Tax=Electrophorus electricus TaxID=8005 RepID=UPI0015D05024|nr:biotin--protein ligase isoform X2 [Electrophorus electricus]